MGGGAARMARLLLCIAVTRAGGRSLLQAASSEVVAVVSGQAEFHEDDLPGSVSLSVPSGADVAEAFTTVVVQSDWHSKRPRTLQLSSSEGVLCEWTHPEGWGDHYSCSASLDSFLSSGSSTELCTLDNGDMYSWSECALGNERALSDVADLGMQLVVVDDYDHDDLIYISSVTLVHKSCVDCSRRRQLLFGYFLGENCC